METFTYQGGQLHAESVPLEEIARTYGTPCYVYSKQAITYNVNDLKNAFGGHPYRICYAVKANGNLSILRHLKDLGCAFDIVSGGELERVRAAGGDLKKSVFSGVGKSEDEIRLALDANIGAFHVESLGELHRIDRITQETGQTAPVALRINPAIEVDTHPNIMTGARENKFGIPMEEVLQAYRVAAKMSGIRICGISCHIGSQLVDSRPIIEAVRQLAELSDRLSDEGIKLEYLDAGGGLGICYQREHPPKASEYVDGLWDALGQRSLTLLVEPGRFVVGNAGILLTQVEHIKRTDANRFAVVDASMTELMRPALYGAWHGILPVRKEQEGRQTCLYDVVGPVCETTDCLGRGRKLAIADGDHLAIFSTGAYASSLGCTYNARPLAAEIMVDGDQHRIIRPRGDLQQMFASELPALE